MTMHKCIACPSYAERISLNHQWSEIIRVAHIRGKSPVQNSEEWERLIPRCLREPYLQKKIEIDSALHTIMKIFSPQSARSETQLIKAMKTILPKMTPAELNSFRYTLQYFSPFASKALFNSIYRDKR